MKTVPIHILLADDDTDDCIFFQEAISGIPMLTSLAVVHNGEQLMERLTQLDLPLPDILFLDLNMPRKNGFECLREIRLKTELSQLPVIMFSTSFELGVVTQLYENGAQYFIRKPSAFSEFQKIIQLTLTLHANNTIIPTTEENFVLNRNP